MWTFLMGEWLLADAENFGGKTKHALTRPSANTQSRMGKVWTQMEWIIWWEQNEGSSYYEMTHRDKNVMDDNLIFIVRH